MVESNDVPLKEILKPGDWIKISVNNFDIFGKVVATEEGKVQVVTSTVPARSPRPAPSVSEMGFVKISMDEVPKRARLWILSRISNLSNTDKNTGKIAGP